MVHLSDAHKIKECTSKQFYDSIGCDLYICGSCFQSSFIRNDIVHCFTSPVHIDDEICAEFVMKRGERLSEELNIG